MTTSSIIISTTCPEWCAITAEEHAVDLSNPADRSTFHRATIDAWDLPNQYLNRVVSVEVQVTRWDDLSSGRTVSTVDVEGDLGRGSQDLAELDPGDARRLAQALVAAADVLEATR